MQLGSDTIVTARQICVSCRPSKWQDRQPDYKRTNFVIMSDYIFSKWSVWGQRTMAPFKKQVSKLQKVSNKVSNQNTHHSQGVCDVPRHSNLAAGGIHLELWVLPLQSFQQHVGRGYICIFNHSEDIQLWTHNVQASRLPGKNLHNQPPGSPEAKNMAIWLWLCLDAS